MGGRKKMFKKEINYFAMFSFEVDLFVPAFQTQGVVCKAFTQMLEVRAAVGNRGAVIGVHR